MAEGHGLVIDGEVVAGEAGRSPATNPVRPDEVVLEAPSASADRLHQVVAAARRAFPAWAALGRDERAPAAEAVVATPGVAR